MCWHVGISASKEGRAITSPKIISGKVHLPFQLQINYTDQDGSRCMRVSTFSKPVTSNKKTADKSEFHANASTYSNSVLLCGSSICYVIQVHIWTAFGEKETSPQKNLVIETGDVLNTIVEQFYHWATGFTATEWQKQVCQWQPG